MTERTHSGGAPGGTRRSFGRHFLALPSLESAKEPAHEEIIRRQKRERLACRKVVAVNDEQCRPELMASLVADATGCDIVCVESIEGGDARIKHVGPDAIIVLVGIDDGAACRLLSILKLDGDTCAIPLHAVMSRQMLTGVSDIASERTQDALCPVPNVRPN